MPTLLWMNEPVCGDKHEIAAAKSVWGANYRRWRSGIQPGSLVIPRYSVVPQTSEVFAELLDGLGAQVITSRSSVESVAGFEWYDCLVANQIPTPRSWIGGRDNFADLPEGRYVVKGKCNSRKFKWATHMYAANLNDLKQVMLRLYDDEQVADQGLVVREFVDYRIVEPALNLSATNQTIPLIDEWRIFILNGKYVDGGFYWLHQMEDCYLPRPDGGTYFGGEPPVGACELAMRCGEALNYEFFAVDVACTPEGEWQVIEVNDGCMSGLQGIDPEHFYLRLYELTT